MYLGDHGPGGTRFLGSEGRGSLLGGVGRFPGETKPVALVHPATMLSQVLQTHLCSRYSLLSRQRVAFPPGRGDSGLVLSYQKEVPPRRWPLPSSHSIQPAPAHTTAAFRYLHPFGGDSLHCQPQRWEHRVPGLHRGLVVFKGISMRRKSDTPNIQTPWLVWTVLADS